jgi:uncharacterized protein YkwD
MKSFNRSIKRRHWFRKVHALIILHFAAAIAAVTALSTRTASGADIARPKTIVTTEAALKRVEPQSRGSSGTTSATTSSAADISAAAEDELCPKSLNATELQVCTATNRERQERGLQALRWDSSLSRVATEFAQDMNERDYFAHESPDGRTMKDRLAAAGVKFGFAGENIAYGYENGNDVVIGWMNSKGHRENILKPEYDRIGAAQVGDRFVQLFTGELVRSRR